MDELLIYFKKVITVISFYLNKLYNKSLFLFNKQMTLKKIYDPLVENKHKQNNELANNLTQLKSQNKNISAKIGSLSRENTQLRAKVLQIKELLVKK